VHERDVERKGIRILFLLFAYTVLISCILGKFFALIYAIKISNFVKFVPYLLTGIQSGISD